MIAHARGELVFTATSASTFVDASTWPPRIRQHAGQYVGDAARMPNGQWLATTSPDPQIKRTYRLRWFDRITSAKHTSEEVEPVPYRDFKPFVVELEEDRQESELVHVHRLESLHTCGELAIAVPRYVGLGELQRPFVRRAGEWREDRSIPPFTKPLSEVTSRCTVACTTLRDGTDVLVWDGHVLASRAHGFEPLFDARLDMKWFYSSEVAPAAKGLFALHDTKLVEVDDGGIREVLPGVSTTAMQRGPGNTLIVGAYSDVLLYDPAENTVATLDEVIGKRREIVGFTDDGGLVLLDQRAYALCLVPASDLAALPRRRADVAPVVPPPEPVATLDALGSTSRPLIAAAGDRIALAHDAILRFHTVDAAKRAVALASPIVGVAWHRDHIAALDARGVLMWFDPDGDPAAARSAIEAPRSLAAAPNGWVAVGEHGVATIDFATGRVDKIAMPGALAAAADPDGTIVIVASERRLAQCRGAELIDIPETAEQLVAIVPLGGRRFACAGEHNLFLLDLAKHELDALSEQTGTALLAASPNGHRIAWASDRGIHTANVVGETLEELAGAHYPSEFSAPEDEPLEVLGLAFLDESRVAVALSHARGNILDLETETAMKLDPHPGDAPSRWVFTFAGEILIAS